MSEKSPKNLLMLATLALLICSVSLCSIYLYRQHRRIAYVRTPELIYGYNGMRDARNSYKAQADIWQANVDTLRVQYQKSLSEYESSSKTLSAQEKADKQAVIKKLEENFRNYSAAIREQAEQKEKEITGAVLNQINSYVEEYAKSNHYDFVIGSSDGNLVYANSAYDITNEVLEVLNKKYKIMPSQPTAKEPVASVNKQ